MKRESSNWFWLFRNPNSEYTVMSLKEPQVSRRVKEWEFSAESSTFPVLFNSRLPKEATPPKGHAMRCRLRPTSAGSYMLSQAKVEFGTYYQFHHNGSLIIFPCYSGVEKLNLSVGAYRLQTDPNNHWELYWKTIK